MSSRLDQALDEVIQDRRSDRSSGGGKRSNNFRGNNGGRTDFTRRRQVDSDGTIRKRLGPSEGIRSFVRTVDVKNDSVRPALVDEKKNEYIITPSIARKRRRQ